MKHLPIGIQTFSSIRQGDFVYIDKTPLVWQMVQKQARYFLSRPRRFGKSLLVDTFKELFEGNKALFNGLYIEDKWDWSKTYPVIKLDFANGVLQSREQLDQSIYNLLLSNQQRLGIETFQGSANDLANYLTLLIFHTQQKYGQKVVVLVDEYDKPILDNIDSPEVSAQMREGLKNVYSVLKSQDAYLQFVFMTGVTKFSKVSLFSGLNQLKDITLDKRFATICGYTQSDLQTEFAEHLAGVDWEKLKQWYNGYQFLGEAVYNPFDILLFIDEGQTYRNFWFETGNPSFLLKLFRKHQYFLPDLSKVEVGEEILDSFDVENINPITLLFQAGYLTIRRAEVRYEEWCFYLEVPNQEVRLSLAAQFVNLYSQLPAHERFAYRDPFHQALGAGDMPALERQIKRLFAAIPWRNFTQNDLDASEGYYASVLYAFFSSLNAQIIAEDISNHGQVDLTIKLAGKVFVIEIKLDKSENYQPQTPNPALQQIIERQYAAKYQGEQVYQIGLIFNQQARNLVQMDYCC